MAEPLPHIQLPSITVNVDEWIKASQTLPRPAAIQHIPSSSVEEYQARLARRLQEYEMQVSRHESLSKDKDGILRTKECAECGEDRHYYPDDFLCYQCRDELEDS